MTVSLWKSPCAVRTPSTRPLSVSSCSTLDALHDLHAGAARGAGKTGGHQVGVGKARLGLVADQRRVVEAGDGQQGAGLSLVEVTHLDALAALAFQGLAQRIEPGTLGRADQVAAPDQPGRGFLVTQVAGEVREHRPGLARQFHVLDHRVVRAQDARGLRGGARADLQALQHQHVPGAETRQVVGDRTADHTGTDHDGVIALHGNPCEQRVKQQWNAA